jgi:hypothetical protein
MLSSGTSGGAPGTDLVPPRLLPIFNLTNLTYTHRSLSLAYKNTTLLACKEATFLFAQPRRGAEPSWISSRTPSGHSTWKVDPFCLNNQRATFIFLIYYHILRPLTLHWYDGNSKCLHFTSIIIQFNSTISISPGSWIQCCRKVVPDFFLPNIADWQLLG